jgi:hypothetical protein
MSSEPEWRPIPGHPSYEVSDQGDVRHHGRILRGHISPRGYREVNVDNRPDFVHRFVARAFLGPKPLGHEVRHLNDTKTDDRVENLAYGTHTDNQRDRVANGRDPNYSKTHCAKGHPYDEANTIHQPRNGRVHRKCRACNREFNKLSMRRQRAAKKETP